MNRHALPPEVKAIISPKKVIPLSRRDSFTLLRRQLEKYKGFKSEAQSPEPIKVAMEESAGGGIDVDDTDEWINDYYNGLTLLDE